MVAAQPEQAALLGARLDALGDVPLAQAIQQLTPLLSHDSDWDAGGRAAWALTYPDIRKWVGLPPRAMILTDQPGQRRRVTLYEIPQAQAQENWQTVQAPRTLAGQERDPQYWFTRLDPDTVYLRYLDCDNAPRFAALAAQVLEVLDKMPAAQRRLIVDLRDNPGGSSSVLRPLLQGLKARHFGRGNGQLRVITNRYTYSSALMNAVQLKELGAKLYGEAPGENLTSYGEVKILELPNSKLRVWYATRLFRLAPKLGDGLLQPDVPVTQTFEQYQKGIDPVLNAALKP